MWSCEEQSVVNLHQDSYHVNLNDLDIKLQTAFKHHVS